jgi:hypothetical protein
MRSSHEFALAAAARVSCCAALLSIACHRSSTSSPEEVEDAELDTGAAPVVVAEPDPYQSDPELDPSLRPSPVSAARLELERCQAEVSASVQGGPLGPTSESCCRALAQALYDQTSLEGMDPEAAAAQQSHDYEVWGNVSNSCCNLIQYSESACSPWGPPTPPSMFARAPVRAARLDLRGPARALRPAGLHAHRLDDRLRAAAIATWRARMVNEHGSAPVFEGLVAQLDTLVQRGMLSEREVERARNFAGQERRHGIACGAVVEALGGEAEAEALPEQAFPEHYDASGELEACLRNLVSICCLSETVAVSLIAAERCDMPEGSLRELLTGIWAEECGHANFGWRLLPKLLAQADAQTRDGLGEYLRLAFAELEAHELAHLPASFEAPPGGEVYGLCDGAQARELFYATVEQVIVPGLEAHGLPAREAWAGRFEHCRDRVNAPDPEYKLNANLSGRRNHRLEIRPVAKSSGSRAPGGHGEA